MFFFIDNTAYFTARTQVIIELLVSSMLLEWYSCYSGEPKKLSIRI
jgi:hypothetical protein